MPSLMQEHLFLIQNFMLITGRTFSFSHPTIRVKKSIASELMNAGSGHKHPTSQSQIDDSFLFKDFLQPVPYLAEIPLCVYLFFGLLAPTARSLGQCTAETKVQFCYRCRIFFFLKMKLLYSFEIFFKKSSSSPVVTIQTLLLKIYVK